MKTSSIPFSGCLSAFGLCVFCGIGILSETSAPGQTITQQAYVKAGNTDANDRFGTSVAMDGDTIVVGAPFEASNSMVINSGEGNNSAPQAGAAYVFVWNGSAWVQQAYLKAANAGAGDNFGQSVAISGNTIVVGAPEEDSNASGVNGDGSNNALTNSGAAYVFVRSGGIWTQQAYLKASNPGMFHNFGFTVALDGDSVVVGATGESGSKPGVNADQSQQGTANAGAAYVFTRAGTNWSQQAYLKASNPGEDDRFGRALAIHNNVIVVGAPFEDSAIRPGQANNNAPDAGAAYVFERVGVVWRQRAFLKASNAEADDEFGRSVAVHGSTIIVGAIGEDSASSGVNQGQGDNNAPGSGAAYLFGKTGSSWRQQAYLKPSNTAAGMNFGSAVAVAPGMLLVGARFHSGSGAAYLFQFNAVSWEQAGILNASNAGLDDQFGEALALTTKRGLIGARFEDSNAIGINGDGSNNEKENSGAAYVFAFDQIGPADLEHLALRGFAPVEPANTFLTFPGAASVNGTGKVLFECGLTGPGAVSGANRAIFDTLGGDPDLVLQSGTPLDGLGGGFTGLKATRFSSPILNQTGRGVFSAGLSGPGAQQVLLLDDGVSLTPVIRTGDPNASLGGAALSGIGEVAQHHTDDALAVCYRLRRSAATGVNAKNDSGILMLKHDGTVLHNAARAGQPTFDDNGVFGKFPGRVAMGDGEYAFFIAPYVPTGQRRAVQRMFQIRKDGSLAFDYFPPTGTIASGVDQDETFSRFLAVNERDFLAVLRATLRGGPASQREGIWNCGALLWLRKGAPFDPVNHPGLFVRRILRFWPVGADQMVVQAVLGGVKGAGVNSRNNQALLLRQSDETWRILLRSGSPAPGAAPATVSKISAVDVDRVNGHYAVLGTLRGAPASANQMLWTGQTTPGTDNLNDTSRLPVQRLRKGAFYTSQATVIGVMRSLALKPLTHPGGAGARGQGQVIGAGGHVVLTITGADKAAELVVLEP